MTKTTIPLGGAHHIDAREYASQGNAILGIRDSGKTYAGTGFAERLMDAGIPATLHLPYQPQGVW